ncbi:MAG TPA: LPS export ABC transporter permease LptG [Burkholderiaceae bacterium]|nr:LPS export ABC transporter permease LptG [Burkholderiaceae bacterium]
MILARYLAREIWLAVGFVLLALLALFFIIDLLRAIDEVGRASYGVRDAAVFVALQLPSTAYLLMPVAALIGTIYALAQFAASSEFTIMRVSGLSTRRAVGAVLRAGAWLVLATFLVGEYVAPRAEDLAQKLRLAQLGRAASTDFRSGFWIKDLVTLDGGDIVGTRFVNAGQVLPDGTLRDVKLYEFDSRMRLESVSVAESADYSGGVGWTLHNVRETRFLADRGAGGPFANRELVRRTETSVQSSRVWTAKLDPNVFTSAFITPQRMSTMALWKYVSHLKQTRQSAAKHEIALWQKAVYPLGVAIMMLLALPFAYLHVRSGGVSLKIFAGIMLGVGFFLLSNLSSNLGLLRNWNPAATALLPVGVALAVASIWLSLVERKIRWLPWKR